MLLLSLISVAAAWEAVAVWPDGALSVPVLVLDGADAPAGWLEAMSAAAATWSGVECSRAGIQMETATDVPVSTTDTVNGIVYGDPSGSLEDGLPAESFFNFSGRTSTVGDSVLREYRDIDSVFGASSLFVTPAQVASGDCHEQWDIQAVATHQMGYALGLWDVCRGSDDCSAEESLATMVPVLPCDSSASTLAPDDEAGLLAIYGPSITLDCDDTFGAAPFTVTCTATPMNAGEPAIEWDFGDGSSGTGGSLEHTYGADGVYTMEVCADVVTDTCAGYRACSHEGVIACGEPSPSLAVTWRQGLGVELSDTSTTLGGCAAEWTWTISDASEVVVGTSSGEGSQGPDPFLVFVPAAGEYNVTLHVEGVGGAGNASLVVSVEPAHTEAEASGGCATTPGASLPWGAVALSMWGLRRRQRCVYPI